MPKIGEIREDLYHLLSGRNCFLLGTEFARKNPLLVRKLVYWANQRLKTQIPDSRIRSEWAEAQVAMCLKDLVVNPATNFNWHIEEKLEEWGNKLSPQERLAIKPLLRVCFPNLPNSLLHQKDFSGWQLKKTWYVEGREDGEYSILNEDVLDLLAYAGQDIGIVTRNSYDCRVLNADTMLIVDVDIQDPNALPDDPYWRASCKSEKQAIAALEGFVSKNPDWNFRAYKTFGGLRYVETTREHDPCSQEVRQLMRELLSDPLYVNLCQFQATFRARLSPKPWRSECNYEATCKFFGSFGSEKVDAKLD